MSCEIARNGRTEQNSKTKNNQDQEKKEKVQRTKQKILPYYEVQWAVPNLPLVPHTFAHAD